MDPAGADNQVFAYIGGMLNRWMGWTRKAAFTGNVTVSDGVLYVLNGPQVEAHAEADGSLLWTWVPPEGTPEGETVLMYSLILVSTFSNTYALDLRVGMRVWKDPTGGAWPWTGMGFCSSPGAMGALPPSR
ncbi:hypothetical protein [Corallococcus exiguus]|uniref:PQQ-binding-like beta-propeller repeat protein n=1 Tax=Corallococcus exiguus TaxID=83462 RepID=A0A7X4YHG5_9BACT|nr:hypothetical protein [Corallococcus exiguus]NBC45341.1 hypothetical protein [Corallococcus exiguus]TNV63068.1 hypothetical protein FH620_16250 [Corallococcus exiguus]